MDRFAPATSLTSSATYYSDSHIVPSLDDEPDDGSSSIFSTFDLARSLAPCLQLLQKRFNELPKYPFGKPDRSVLAYPLVDLEREQKEREGFDAWLASAVEEDLKGKILEIMLDSKGIEGGDEEIEG